MTTDLYCTLCGKPLQVQDVDGIEANLKCPQGHLWWYSPVHLAKGDVLAFLVDDGFGFQCGNEGPYAELLVAQDADSAPA